MASQRLNFCPFCGHSLPVISQNYCPECGTRLTQPVFTEPDNRKPSHFEQTWTRDDKYSNKLDSSAIVDDLVISANSSSGSRASADASEDNGVGAAISMAIMLIGGFAGPFVAAYLLWDEHRTIAWIAIVSVFLGTTPIASFPASAGLIVYSQTENILSSIVGALVGICLALLPVLMGGGINFVRHRKNSPNPAASRTRIDKSGEEPSNGDKWFIWLVAFILIGGGIQGVLAREDAMRQRETGLAGLGVLIALLGVIFLRKRWGWKSLFFIPVIWMATVPVALTSEAVYAQYLKSDMRLGSSNAEGMTSSAPNANCDGFNLYLTGLEEIGVRMTAQNSDVERTNNSTTTDLRRWLADLRSIKTDFVGLHVPPQAAEYHTYSLESIDILISAYSQLAFGDIQRGSVLLDEYTDRISSGNGQSLLTSAHLVCGRN